MVHETVIKTCIYTVSTEGSIIAGIEMKDLFFLSVHVYSISVIAINIEIIIIKWLSGKAEKQHTSRR
jgi:hypothetical protein